MKKILTLIFTIILLYAVVNHKFLEAMAYLHDNDFTNNAKAVALLTDATNNDKDSKSAFLLGYYYKTKKYNAINFDKSHDFYLLASKFGDQEAKMLVAWNFYKGKGCSKNIQKAKELLTELAISGSSKAKEILKFVIRN